MTPTPPPAGSSAPIVLPADSAPSSPAPAASVATTAPVQTVEAWATALKVSEHVFAGARVYAGWSTGREVTQADFQKGIDAFSSLNFGHRPIRHGRQLGVTSTGQKVAAAPSILEARYFGKPAAQLTGSPKSKAVQDAANNAARAAKKMANLSTLPPPKSSSSK